MRKKILTLFSVLTLILILGVNRVSAESTQTYLTVASPEGTCDPATIPWYGVSQTLKDKVHYHSPAFTGVSSIKVRTYDTDHDITVTLYECKYGGEVADKKTGKVNNGWSEIEFTGLDPEYYYFVDYYYFTLFGDTDTLKVELIN